MLDRTHLELFLQAVHLFLSLFEVVVVFIALLHGVVHSLLQLDAVAFRLLPPLTLLHIHLIVTSQNRPCSRQRQ